MESQSEGFAQKPNTAQDVAGKVLEIQQKKREAEAKIKVLQEEVQCIDKELDEFLQSVVACL